ncbi:MAG: RNA polymerase sigma factor [Solirubrobacteraceae bacterium]
MSVTACGVSEDGLGRIAEVGTLYARTAGLVRGHVRTGVAAPEAVIDDACQFAWSRLLHHRDGVSGDRAVAWLVTTALHEAYKLIRRAQRDVSLEGLAEETGDLHLGRGAPSPEEIVEPRLRLEVLDVLPERQQRLIWLQGLGFDYREMATRTGATVRTVERQLTKARRTLRSAEAAEGAA